MKRTAWLMLAVILLISCVIPAFAEETEAPPPDGYVPKREDNLFRELGTAQIEEKGSEGERYKASYPGGILKQLVIGFDDHGGKPLSVTLNAKGQVTKATWGTGDERITFRPNAWKDRDGNVVAGPDLAFVNAYYLNYQNFGYWYRNNTMSLVGLYLKELKPELTDKWYQVVPIDLRKQGTYRYQCAASNMYYMGACDVTVRGDEVKVDYVLPKGDAYPQRNCICWFTSLEEITPEFLDKLESPYRYGEAVSISEKLKGHEIALLFICNHLNYRVPVNYLGTETPIRYFRGKDRVKELKYKYNRLYKEMTELYPDEAAQ